MTKRKSATRPLALAFVAAVAMHAASAGAESVVFTLDPSQSTLIATGTLSGDTAFAQMFGSNLTSYSGTISVDRTASTIRFLDGSSIDAASQPLRQEPDVGGEPGRATADYGLVADNGFGETVAAFRDITLGLLSEALVVAGDGSFSASDVEVALAGGSVDWNTGFSFSGQNLAGRVLANTPANTPTLVAADGVETLTLPIRFNVLFSTLTAGDSNIRFSGNLVATRETVPPPIWVTDGGGSWGNAANWSTGAPATGSANFLDALTSGAAVITLDGNRAVSRLRFDNPNTYEIAPGTGGALTVGSATSGSIIVASGQHRISAPLALVGEVNLTITSGAVLEITSPLSVQSSNILTMAGGGELRTGPLTNRGEVNLSEGSVQFLGPVTNHPDAFLSVGAASATFAGAVTNHADGTLIIDSGASASFTGGVNNAGIIGGGGTKFFENAGNSLGVIDGAGTTVINTGASATADQIRGEILEVHGTLKINPDGGPGGVSLLYGLTIGSPPGSFLDLTNNHLIIDNGDIGQIKGYIESDSLMSSLTTAITTLAAIQNDDGTGEPIIQAFFDEPLFATDVLVKFTYKGDANFDGRVSIADYLAIDRGAARGLTGWTNGDFNGDGTIDGLDYFLIDQSFLGQTGPLSAAGTAGVSVVPEASALLLGLLALGFMRRPRPDRRGPSL